MRQNEGAMALGNKDATRPRPLVVVTDDRFGDNAALERTILEREGCDLRVAACRTAADVIEAGRDADALLVNMAPLNAEAIAGLERCRVLAESSPSIVTPLNKLIGYEAAAKIAKHAVAKGITVREAVIDLGYVERGDLTEAQLDEKLDLLSMTHPG